MSERRALIQGLDNITDADPELAADFILNRHPLPISKTAAHTPPKTKTTDVTAPGPSPAPRTTDAPSHAHLTGVGRVPVGARVRTDLAAALKRASLERQLHGVQPNSVQEILEDALELWLLKHGHLA